MRMGALKTAREPLPSRFTSNAPGAGFALCQELGEGGGKRVGALALEQVRGVGTGDEDEVVAGGELLGVCPEGLAQRPLHGVSPDGVADLAADRDPEAHLVARLALGPRKRVHDEETVALRARFAIDAVEITAPGEPCALSARAGRHCLGSEALAALAPAPADHLTPSASAHAGAEPVRAGALSLLRLIGALQGT